MKLNEIIKQYRAANNLTMQEFADRCGLSKGYISMLEKGRHPQSQRPLAPSMDTFKRLCEGMHISIQDLFSVLEVQDWIDDGFDVERELSIPLYPDEAQLVEDYRGLTPPGKEYIRQTMAMAKQTYSEKK